MPFLLARGLRVHDDALGLVVRLGVTTAIGRLRGGPSVAGSMAITTAACKRLGWAFLIIEYMQAELVLDFLVYTKFSEK